MNAPVQILTLDCRGMQCPAPILQIAKRARELSGSPAVLEVLADDHDFPNDVEAWIRTTRSALLDRDDGDFFRVFIGLNGVTSLPAVHRDAPASLDAFDPTSGTLIPDERAPERSEVQRPQPPAALAPQPAPAAGGPLDLRGVSSSAALMRLANELLARPDDVVELVADSPTFASDIYAWASATRSRVSDLRVDGALVTLKVQADPALASESTALAPVAPQAPQAALPAPAERAPAERAPALPQVAADPRCTLLVLHNDFEALMAAMMVANAAAAQGMKTQIFFSFWGVNLLRSEQASGVPEKKPTLMQRMMKWMMPAGPENQKLGQMNFGGAGIGMMSYLMKRNNVLSLGQLMDAAAEQEVEFVACTMSMGLMGIDKVDLEDRPNLSFGGVTSFVEASRLSQMSMVF